MFYTGGGRGINFQVETGLVVHHFYTLKSAGEKSDILEKTAIQEKATREGNYGNLIGR